MYFMYFGTYGNLELDLVVVNLSFVMGICIFKFISYKDVFINISSHEKKK